MCRQTLVHPAAVRCRLGLVPLPLGTLGMCWLHLDLPVALLAAFLFALRTARPVEAPLISRRVRPPQARAKLALWTSLPEVTWRGLGLALLLFRPARVCVRVATSP